MSRRRPFVPCLCLTLGLLLTASMARAVDCSGAAAFKSCTAYASGAKVTFNGNLYHSIAAISSTRDCPPNSPYDPSNDNWWTNDGACSGGATATATATKTNSPTATATTSSSRATATATSTPTPTSSGSSIANGNYKVVNKNSAKCVDAAAAATANGTVVQQYTCNGTNAQVWQFSATDSGYYKVLTVNNTGQGWDVTGGTSATSDGAKIQLWGNGGATNQQFQPVSEGGGYYHFVARNSGKCVDVPSASTADAVQLQQWACNGTGAQSFQITSVSATATPTATSGSGGGTSGSFPAKFVAPYVETYSNVSMTNAANATGNKYYTLAFMLTGGGCTPSWNGNQGLGSFYSSDINSIRNKGGDVLISFGGASGTELGLDCGDVSSLQSAYQKVVNNYGLKWMDFDIESGAESDTASIDRRNKAIKNLQNANSGLQVSYTLAVDRTGLPSAQQNLLSNAKSNGVNVAVVNIMAMDYGPCYSDMGQAAVDAANATIKQLGNLGISAKVGITPMIGTNDTTCEVFSTNDAQVVTNYANGNANIRELAYWALGADGGYSYLNVFKAFK